MEKNPNLVRLDDDAAAPLLAKLEAQLAAIEAAVTNPLFHGWDYARIKSRVQDFKDEPTKHRFQSAQDAMERYKVPLGNEYIFEKQRTAAFPLRLQKRIL